MADPSSDFASLLFQPFDPATSPPFIGPVFSPGAKGADVKGANAKPAGPVAQDAGGVAQQPREPSDEQHAAALRAKLATPTSQRAEIALDVLQDARLSYAQVAHSRPPPSQDQLYGARLQLDTAQAAAGKAVADNLAERIALRDQKIAAWRAASADQQAHPHARELKAKVYWANLDRYFSEEKVAVAESLQDIVNGQTVSGITVNGKPVDKSAGRTKLLRDTGLDDARAAEAELAYVRQVMFAGGLSRGERLELANLYRTAASANRTEWAAAHRNAIAGGEAALIDETRRGLERAEQGLLGIRFVD